MRVIYVILICFACMAYVGAGCATVLSTGNILKRTCMRYVLGVLWPLAWMAFFVCLLLMGLGKAADWVAHKVQRKDGI